MASSGSVDFQETRNELVNDALVLCGAIEAGEAPSAVDSSYATRQLNRMVKAWQTNGTHIWKRRECHLFLSKTQSRYKIGPNSTDHTAEIGDSFRTQLSVAAAAGAGSISVDSTANIAVSDNIGVVLDDGTIDWFTVSAIPGAITLSGTLTSAAAVDSQVFSYTTKIDRPLRVLDAQLTDENDLDTPIIVFSHEEYQRTPNKTGTGRPNEVYYQAEIPDGFAYVWQAPSSSIWRVRMTCLLPIEDFDDSSNTADLPQEWEDAIVWSLADRLAPSYGTPERQAARIEARAIVLIAAVRMFDQEPVSVFFQPHRSPG